jgi:GTPase involved in cell partitioning and DNA repair
MLPLIIAGVAVTGLATAAATYYRKRGQNQNQQTENTPIPLGDIAVWGRPDAGKTTFISCLRGIHPSGEKEQTGSIKRYGKFEITSRDGRIYGVPGLCDIPGGPDRLENWLAAVESRKHIFYILSLAKLEDSEYLRNVRTEIEHTVKRLNDKAKDKRIHVIGAHLDNSKWKDFEPARVRETILQDDTIREIREHFGKGAGYFYASNLLDRGSAMQLIEDIINDCSA